MPPIHDILMLSLQFLYAFGGLFLMGSLIFNIMKNQALVNEKRLRFEQDFDVELTSQLAKQETRAVLRVGQAGAPKHADLDDEARTPQPPTSKRVPKSGLAGSDMPLKGRGAPVGESASGQAMVSRYRLASGLAARGFNAKDIRRRVALPQCEIDLIASISGAQAKGRWEAHQSMLDAIDAGI